MPYCGLAKQRNERHIELHVCGRITRRRHGGRKTKKWAPYLITLNRIDLCKNFTGTILDWQYKEIAAILNHIKGFTEVLDRDSFQLRTRKR